MKTHLVEILASDSYFSKNGKIDFANFTGIVTMHDWKTGFLGGLYFENGIKKDFIKEYYITAGQGKVNGKIMGRTQDDCGFQTGYGTSAGYNVIWVSQPCDSGFFYGPKIISWYDYIAQDEGPWKNNGSGGGGGDGGSYPYFEPTPVPVSIVNNLIDECLKGSVSRLIEADLVNDINNAINQIFNNPDKTDTRLTFNEDRSLDKPARTNVETEKPFHVIITLNPVYLKNSSSEYVAATIYHEAMHGYLLYNQPMLSQLEQHVEMATTYVDWLASALQEVYPSLSDKDAYGLSFRGLKDMMISNPGYWNDMIKKYGFDSNSELIDLTDNYRDKLKGTACK